jgi:hypothetical protein
MVTNNFLLSGAIYDIGIGMEKQGIINPSPKKVTICASEAKPKQRGEAPVCTRNTIAKGKGDEED